MVLYAQLYGYILSFLCNVQSPRLELKFLQLQANYRPITILHSFSVWQTEEGQLL